MTVICPDVSGFQQPLTDAYGRRMLIMRVAFGAHYEDPHFLANAREAADLYRRGRIDGVILYSVWLASATPAEQFAFTWRLIGPTVPPWLAGIMLDIESWNGASYEQHGDHSRAINTLYGMHAHKLGSWSACIGYGNTGDLAALWPDRDSRCKVIVAGYSSQLTYKRIRGAIGQQYSDGSSRWPVPTVDGKALPRASAPFGHCDHNVFPGFRSAAALRTFLRPAKAGPPPRKPPAKAPTPTPTTPAKPHPAPIVLYPAPPKPPAPYLVSTDRRTAAFLRHDGQLEVHRDHKPLGLIHLTK